MKKSSPTRATRSNRSCKITMPHRTSPGPRRTTARSAVRSLLCHFRTHIRVAARHTSRITIPRWRTLAKGQTSSPLAAYTRDLRAQSLSTRSRSHLCLERPSVAATRGSPPLLPHRRCTRALHRSRNRSMSPHPSSNPAAGSHSNRRPECLSCRSLSSPLPDP